MKKKYAKPSARMVDFNYDEQIVASSGCEADWTSTSSKLVINCSEVVQDLPYPPARMYSGCVELTLE